MPARGMNEACTAPEMRHIRAALGDLRGRTLLARGSCDRTEAVPYAGIAGAFDDLVGRRYSLNLSVDL